MSVTNDVAVCGRGARVYTIYVISFGFLPGPTALSGKRSTSSRKPCHRQTRSRWREFSQHFCRFFNRPPHHCPFPSLRTTHDMAPRAQTAANPSLRNRNRVTNKTRLKVIKGNIDADPIVLDEDEERARVVSTAGVDAEDANVR